MKQLILLLLTILTISCTSETTKRLSEISEGNLIGKWEIQKLEQGDDFIIYNNTPCLNKKIEFKSNYEFITYSYKAPNCNLITSFDDFQLQNKFIIIDNQEIEIIELTNILKLKYLDGRIETYKKL